MFASPVRAPASKATSPPRPSHTSGMPQRSPGRRPSSAPPPDFCGIPVFAPAAGRPPVPSPLRQARLDVGAVDDPREHEAERVAEQVTRVPAAPLTTLSSPPPISHEPTERNDAAEPVGVTHEAPPLVRQVLGSPGRPLNPA